MRVHVKCHQWDWLRDKISEQVTQTLIHSTFMCGGYVRMNISSQLKSTGLFCTLYNVTSIFQIIFTKRNYLANVKPFDMCGTCIEKSNMSRDRVIPVRRSSLRFDFK